MKLKKAHNIYFIGIGGIGMSALAIYFHENGKHVAGYDRTATKITDKLGDMGIAIHFNDDVTLIPKTFKNKENTIVIYTPAIPSNFSEFSYFKNSAFKIYKRAQILGDITKDSTCLAVAGTHGKTTTTSLLGHILKESGVDSTSFLGGISENYHSNLILGGTEVTVVEADEFDRSFLELSPNIACVTSMDADHLDIYGDKTALVKSFNEFALKVSDTLIVRNGLPLAGLTYGIEDESDFVAKNIRIQSGKYIFDVYTPSNKLKNVELNLPGKHNVLNTVAALAIAICFGIPLPAIAKAILSFKGVERRFSYKIKTKNLVLIDDYAHHPTEIRAVIEATKEMYPKQKILGVFQPHLFSRTKDFADDFASSLALFDELLLLDIYPARELPLPGITSQWLLDKIDLASKKVVSKINLIHEIKNNDAKIILMMGAGDIGELVEKVKIELIKKENKS